MEGMKTCPDCAEEVQGRAEVCKHCGYKWPGGRAWRRGASRRLAVMLVLAIAAVLLVWVLADNAISNADDKVCRESAYTVC